MSSKYSAFYFTWKIIFNDDVGPLQGLNLDNEKILRHGPCPEGGYGRSGRNVVDYYVLSKLKPEMATVLTRCANVVLYFSLLAATTFFH